MKMNKDNKSLDMSRQWWAGPAAFFVSLLALPANAGIVIPDDPLTTGARVPPNILFILDNSGSMADDKMPDNVPSTSTPNVASTAYTRNTLSYNPSIAYKSWTLANGNLMSGGNNYAAAYSSDQFVPYSGTGPGGSGTITTTSSTINLFDSVRTFHVPIDASRTDDAYLKVGENYYRYQIMTDGKIYRSEYLSYSSANTPANAGSMGCGTGTSGKDWRNCTAWNTAWTGRTEAQERANYAMWYSYHRTRYKAAKAGASAAFAELGSNVRVGFRTIWNNTNTVQTGNMPTPSVPIPVGYNNGLFTDSGTTGNANAYNNRTQWYNRLFTTTGSSTTPLRQALTDAGAYFSSSSAAGPYGPETGTDQLACRQNFTILTTDGFWNESGYNNNTIGNSDAVNGSAITGPNGISYTYIAADPYTGGLTSTGTPTLADVAMHYWKNDLRTDMDNVVPSNSKDVAFWQHMATFTIGLGLSGTVDQKSVAEVLADGHATVGGAAGWPQPVNNTITAVDDLLHAAVNGHGTYVAANSPGEFAAGLKSALAAVTERTGSFSNVAANSTSLNTGSKVFSASYISGAWTGQVKGQAVSLSGLGTGWVSSIPSVGSRKVFTSNGTTGETFPTTAQAAVLARTGGVTDYPVTAQNNANYIKGDTSNEERNGGVLRNRTGPLGDIVGSSPAYVKETNTLYVGANDGMLHAFDADDGRELFAYVPNGINFSQLGTLSRPDYAHKFFVDGPVVTSSRSLTPGKTILVGTLGKGGKGVYALDVTSPVAATATSVFKWERVETPSNNMGLVLGRPIMAKVPGTSAAVIMGNGVNSTNDRAVLVVLNAETGAVIREIDTGAGSATAPNGLSAPTGVYGADGKTLAYVYAGDMLGNVWKFNLTSSVPGSWSATKIFSAQDANGNAQPITSGVTVAVHPKTNKRWVFFGTGRYLTSGDAANTGVQSMYGFIEGSSTLDRSSLIGRTLTVTSDVQSGYKVRAFQAKASLPANKDGWYVDLPDTGERIVQDAQVVATYLLTASMVPTNSACNSDGRGYINALDAFTGTSAGFSYFNLDNNAASNDKVQGIPIGSVDAGVGMPTLPSLLRGLTLFGGSSGNLGVLRTLSPRWDRVSWRELRRD